jgi:hypothetical protein
MFDWKKTKEDLKTRTRTNKTLKKHEIGFTSSQIFQVRHLGQRKLFARFDRVEFYCFLSAVVVNFLYHLGIESKVKAPWFVHFFFLITA